MNKTTTPDERLRQLDNAGFDAFAEDFWGDPPVKKQSRWHSLLESVTNIVVGLALSWTITILVLPYYGYTPSVGQALEITLIFTAVSLVRSYAIRRLFNGR